MKKRRWIAMSGILIGMLALSLPSGFGQPPGQDQFKGKGGPGGFGGGPFGGQERKLLKQFDKDGDGLLNLEERTAARESLKNQGGGFGGGGMRKGGFGKGKQEPAKPGPKVGVDEVKKYSADTKLYDTKALRTIFIEFESPDWEKELQDFHNTDVEVPATVTVDGVRYPKVGVHFRGMSSYGMIPAGYKRSLNLTMDLADSKQRLYGYKTLNLLNAHEDSTFLSPVLYSHIANQYIPTPKANLVKVVINGESWGVYINVQQFNKEFLAENFKTTKGARWKVRGSPGGGGGLEYLGDNIADYKRRYEIKTKDEDKDWKALIELTRVLNQTPPDKLEEALKPIVDIDGLLSFLALDIALINCDGYWIRASDYSIYRDPKGVFHFIPHDMNEAFRPAGGPGFGGGGPGGMGGGPGGGNMRMGRPGEILPGILQDILQLSPEQKKKLADLQKDTDAKLEKLLNEEQRNMFKGMLQGPPGGFPGGPGGFPGGPGGGFPGGPPPGGPGGFPGGPGAGPGPGGFPGGPPPGGSGGGFPGGPPPGGPGGGFPGGPPPGGPGGFPGGPGGPGGGFGGPGGGRGGSRAVDLDPLYGISDARKPLRAKILAVPSLREKYLARVKTIAEKSLDWKELGPFVANLRKQIDAEVKADTRKLESYDDFVRNTADTVSEARPQGMEWPIRKFADERRKYLLDYKPTPPKK